MGEGSNSRTQKCENPLARVRCLQGERVHRLGSHLFCYGSRTFCGGLWMAWSVQKQAIPVKFFEHFGALFAVLRRLCCVL
jgi:hypothetical protein